MSLASIPMKDPPNDENRSFTTAQMITKKSKKFKNSRRKSILTTDEYDNSSSEGHLQTSASNTASSTEVEDSDLETTPKAKVDTSAFASSESSETESTTPTELKQRISSEKRRKELSKAYRQHRKLRYKQDGSIRSKFADIKSQPRATIFDAEIQFGSKFYGFAVAFWFAVTAFGARVLLEYETTQGSILRSLIVKLMLKDIWKVAATDLAMYLSTYFSVFVQMFVKKGWVNWSTTGWKLIGVFEVWFVGFFIWFARHMEYPWIAKIFLMLHSIVMLMKVHSYSFYNGYLWNITKELKFSEGYLKKHAEDDSLSEEVSNALTSSVEFCKFELSSQSKEYPFPTNISLSNFFMYSMFPTVVYEIDYPRNERIRKHYLFGKIAGIFGVIFLMITIAQQNLYPIVMKCLEMRETLPLWDRIQQYPLIILDTIPPFLSIYILTFYLIWELILNAIAELTCFADREFYRYWWNSVDWNDYARDWNVPIHQFLLRHVYHSSISAFNVSKGSATLITFLLSSVVHELAMWVIFDKLRGYLLLLQMAQLPLIAMSKTPLLKGKPTVGNCIFWFGIVFGPSLMCTMYLVF
ncbi:unnamed protein product [Ambrosiozyma monospora]|uniref:Unnamed protein product n=1 Tax=Ambrosiozyma monospora TaxID=43982 RepID=A0ACB5SZD6_AMBMO|nr:unnamed protein product [Ambrosiozyma monospora]